MPKNPENPEDAPDFDYPEEQTSFSIGDELPGAEDGNPDLDAILQQASGDYAGPDDDDIVIDWNPEKNLIPEGEHPATLVDVKVDKTNPQDGRAAKPTLRWTVRINDPDWPFQRDKNIPTANGKGIERLNIEIAQAFGVEVGQNTDGTMKLSLRELRAKCIGQPCVAVIEHNAGKKDPTMMFDNLKSIKPYVGEGLEGIG